MLKLDRKAFTSSFTVPALKIDAKHCHKMRKALSRVILRTPRIKDIVPDPSDRCKKLLLLDSFNHGNGNFKEDEQKAVNESNAEMTQHELLLTYDHYTAEQILSAILPDEMEVTSSFATVGHIAHMNLRECHQPFREIIGKDSNLLCFVKWIRTCIAVPQWACDFLVIVYFVILKPNYSSSSYVTPAVLMSSFTQSIHLLLGLPLLLCPTTNLMTLFPTYVSSLCSKYPNHLKLHSLSFSHTKLLCSKESPGFLISKEIGRFIHLSLMETIKLLFCHLFLPNALSICKLNI